MRFAEHDADGNESLDFEEFLAMQPESIRRLYSSDDIREWFDAADENGSGDLSANEFFKWSMSNAAQKYGSTTLQQIFHKFDADGTGELDAIEFSKAASAMGFGAAAYDLFKDLDTDGTGTVSYAELLNSLKHQAPPSRPARQLLTTMMWSYDAGVREEVKPIDTSKWSFRGRDVATVRSELQRHLNQGSWHVADLLRIFNLDLDGMPRIDDVQFSTTMRRIGYNGAQQVLDDVFKHIDADGSGFVTFHEFYEFVRGKRHSLDPRTRIDRLLEGGLRLEPPEGVQLDEIAWDVEVLRVMLMQMIDRCRISPPELLLVWTRGIGKRTRHSFVPPGSNKAAPTTSHITRVRVNGGFSTILTGSVDAERSGKRGLNRNDFMNVIFSSFFVSDDPAIADLWVNQVMSVADEAFTTMLGLVRGENFFTEIGILHLERFLGATSPPIAPDYAFPLKTKVQLREQEARRELGKMIIQQMTLQEEAQAARQKLLQQMGAGGRRRDRQGVPNLSASQPRMARRKIDHARLASLSAPRHPKTIPKEKPFPFPLIDGSPNASRLERVASAPLGEIQKTLNNSLWSIGPSSNEPFSQNSPIYADSSTSVATKPQLPALLTTHSSIRIQSSSPPRCRSPEDLRRVVYMRCISPNSRPRTSESKLRRHPPPASHWPAVRY